MTASSLAIDPILVALAATLLIFSILWRIHVALHDASIIDLYWAPGFVVIALVWLPYTKANLAAAALLLILLALWAFRLTAYLAIRYRKNGKEDSRYAAMRAAGGHNWWLRSLVTVFWLQAVLQWAIASPVHALMNAPGDTPVSWITAGIGTAIFAVGFAIETVADVELARFRHDASNHGKLLTSGLRAWCRYPNYFGEALLWWGIGLVAYAASASAWAFAGPLLLNVLLLKLSGVAMLDRNFASAKPGFAEWAAHTNAFIPWPPKRSGSDADQTTGTAEDKNVSKSGI